MALTLYRRHRRDCNAGHPEESRSGEFDERKKSWRRCSCPIFASGTLQRKFRRQTTGQWEWTPAKAVVAEFEHVGTWGKAAPKLQAAPPREAAPKRITIDEAVKVFLAELPQTIPPAPPKKTPPHLSELVQIPNH